MIARSRLLAAFAFLLALGNAWAAPPWAKNDSYTLVGSSLTIVCAGRGLSLDLARSEAIQGCTGTAARHLASEIRVRAVSIETERDTAFHQEIAENTVLSGLQCKPDREAFEQDEHAYRVWIRCKFDLSKTQASPERVAEDKVSPDGSVSNRSILLPAQQQLGTGGTHVSSQDRTMLSIASVPACESLLIQGQRPRVVRCTGNPMSVSLDKGDQRIIVRSDGHLPKTVELTQGRRPANDSVQIILDRK